MTTTLLESFTGPAPDAGTPPRARIHPDRGRSWLRRALPVVLAHRRLFVVSLGGTLISLVLQMALPRLTMAAIDQALVSHRSALLPFVLALIGVGLLRWGVSYQSRNALYRVAYEIEYDFRSMMFEHLSRMSAAFYDRVQTGQLISRANSDIRSVQMFLAFAPSILTQVLGFFFAFAVMLTINVPLAFVAVAPMPFVYLAGVKMRRLLFPISWVVQSRLADVATRVDENVNGARVVKAFAAEQRQLDEMVRAAHRVEWASVRQNDIRAVWAPLMENLPRLGLALVLLVGGWMVVNGQTTVGALVAFNAYVVMAQAPFRMLGMLMMMSQRAAASAERIYEILDEQPDVVEKPDATTLADVRGDVRFDGVTFGYAGRKAVLEGLSLHVESGETVAVVGRTGSGKSTLIRLLMRQYDPDRGAVRIDGTDLRDLTLECAHRLVGVVPDEPFLFSVSLRENIAYARPDATADEVETAARAAGAHEFISALPDGYETVVGERGYTLSGGQRQRIAIARTLLADPRVLVLDDATSAVDVQREQEIHEALRTLVRGRTTLLVAHRLSTIALADRVAFLEDGRVAAVGTHEHLLSTNPRYAAVLASEEERARQERAAEEAVV